MREGSKMIKGTFKREENGSLISFEVSGHSTAGPFGSDIVCAAVSALTFNTVNSIEALAGFTPILDIDHEALGYLYFETIADITQEQSNIAQILLESLLLGLQSIQTEHSEFMTIKTVTKNRGGATQC